MIDADKKQFLQLMMDSGSIYAKEVSPSLAGTYFGLLVDHSIENVTKAFASHAKDPDNGRFFPKPADIIREINLASDASNGVLEANEAWAIACHISSESESSAVTKEILGAMTVSSGCGDQVAARMAFIESYRRLCNAARANGEPTKWFMSFGSEKAHHEQAVMSALHLNRITQAKAENLLPHLQQEPQMHNLLASAKEASGTNEHAKSFLKDLMELMEPTRSVNTSAVTPARRAEIEAELNQIKVNMNNK